MRKEEASLRERAAWRCVVLSCGESSTVAAAAKAGEKLPPGATTRVPDVHVGHTPWPNLHGYATRETFMQAIYGGTARHYGHAGRAFLTKLVEARVEGDAELRESVEDCRARLRGALPANADPQAKHTTRLFGLVAAAGEMATAWGITGWQEGEALLAAKSLMLGWLAERGGESGEERAALAVLRDFIGRHGPSRFEIIGRHRQVGGFESEAPTSDGRAVVNRAGWRRWEGDDWSYFILPSVWDEMHAPADGKAAARFLADRGILRRGEGNNLKAKVRVPGESSLRAYHVIRSKLHAEPGDDERKSDGVPVWRRRRLRAVGAID
jgi:uncharacterized protein (DUF927 family)